MSFLDDSPELAADLADVFNILYPPSPSSTLQDDWEEEDSSNATVTKGGPAEVVDLDGPVKDLAPLDVHDLATNNVEHEPTSESKFPGYIEALLGKLSRKRIRAILDSTLPLIGHADPEVEEKKTKKRRLIEMIQPETSTPERSDSVISILPQHRPSAHTKTIAGSFAKRDRQRSSTGTTTLPRSDPSAYNPFSALSYLSRLRTFSLTTYPSKPSVLLSPQACAQAGWINQGGKDRVFCQVCQKAWRVEMPTDVAAGGIKLNAALKEKYMQLLAKQLVLAHSPSCPWRIRQCPSSIHQDLLFLNPPISSHLAPSAFDLESHILAKGEMPSIAHFEEADFDLVSPLSTTETECLTKNLNLALDEDVLPRENLSGPVYADKVHRNHATSSTPISSTAAVLSFFGWNVLRPGRPDSIQTNIPTKPQNTGSIVPDVLRCRICERKIGLWAFRRTLRTAKEDNPNSAPKALNVLLEHREFCPIRTLAGSMALTGGETPWWSDAAILHESQIGGMREEMRGERGGEDSSGQVEQGDSDGQGVTNSLGNVVDVLKGFIRPGRV